MDECELIAEIFKALSHPTRLRILKILKNRKCNIIEISEELDLTQSSVSQHLKILENVGIIRKRKEGNIVFCDLKYEAIFKLFNDAKKIVHEELQEAHKMIKNS
ncbi:ArsR/SmtB family transcription factor [Marinitoga aeolica]|uniref:Winged helix-turn-helix transcriptional regulator n=1 Tax=Marinitoga aeolica TaxID=2809031 RepID=A0ABY8PQ16_9BACT|nr:metalloregulator ArsR/SmtB family transcription factor [Marinitoga aeolica]WGS64730.1 winged helix-turn-helix transcriptional regulator [Marinitoga aeolica]